MFLRFIPLFCVFILIMSVGTESTDDEGKALNDAGKAIDKTLHDAGKAVDKALHDAEETHNLGEDVAKKAEEIGSKAEDFAKDAVNKIGKFFNSAEKPETRSLILHAACFVFSVMFAVVFAT